MPSVTLDYDDKFAKTLSGLQDSSSANTNADVIRDALAVYSYLKSNTPVSSNGEQRLTIRTGEKETDLILP